MRSYAKFQLGQQMHFFTIPGKLMGGCINPTPVPARVNISKVFFIDLAYLSKVITEKLLVTFPDLK